VALVDEVIAERLDKCRLANAGRTGDADTNRIASVRHEFLEQRAGLGAMIAARRLDQRNRAREGTPVTIEYSLS
jgi:hypothetical protein